MQEKQKRDRDGEFRPVAYVAVLERGAKLRSLFSRENHFSITVPSRVLRLLLSAGIALNSWIAKLGVLKTQKSV